MDRRTRLFTLLLATVTILLASCSTEPGESPDVSSREPDTTQTETLSDTAKVDAEPDDPFVGAVEVEDQTSDGATVTVARAGLGDDEGWVVIHADESGAPGDVLGHAAIEPDQSGATVDGVEGNADVVVTLDQPLEPGEHVLWAMLHLDAEPAGTYQFPGNDVPVTHEDAVVMAPFTVTVEG